MPVVYDKNATSRPSMEEFVKTVREDTLSKVHEVAMQNMDDRIERHVDHEAMRKAQRGQSAANDNKDRLAPKL